MKAHCTDHTPPWFVGHWREWHRGHGCDRDDGKPRSDSAVTEIQQHASNEATGFLTDAELSFLRGSTTSGNTLLVRALDELTTRRSTTEKRSFATVRLTEMAARPEMWAATEEAFEAQIRLLVEIGAAHFDPRSFHANILGGRNGGALRGLDPQRARDLVKRVQEIYFNTAPEGTTPK